MSKRSVRKRRGHKPPEGPPTESINGCQQQGCPELGLQNVDVPGLGITYFCPTHYQMALRELRKQNTVQAIRRWEAEVTEPPKKGLIS